jgi:hypothetical protein
MESRFAFPEAVNVHLYVAIFLRKKWRYYTQTELGGTPKSCTSQNIRAVRELYRVNGWIGKKRPSNRITFSTELNQNLQEQWKFY